MKQLSAMGARRQFFRNPRRLRALRPGDEFPDGVDLLAAGPLGYFTGTSSRHGRFPVLLLLSALLLSVQKLCIQQYICRCFFMSSFCNRVTLKFGFLKIRIGVSDIVSE